jgi:hypothetical protein
VHVRRQLAARRDLAAHDGARNSEVIVSNDSRWITVSGSNGHYFDCSVKDNHFRNLGDILDGIIFLLIIHSEKINVFFIFSMY